MRCENCIHYDVCYDYDILGEDDDEMCALYEPKRPHGEWKYIGTGSDEIKERSKPEFLRICAGEEPEDRRGEWIPDDELTFDPARPWWYCSHCGERTGIKTKYCPECGFRNLRAGE